MIKKTMSVILISLLLSTLFATCLVAAEDTIETEENGGFIESIIEFEGETVITEPVSINKDNKVDLKVRYKLDMSDLAERFFFNRRIGRAILFGSEYFFRLIALPKATVNLSIEEKSDWCTAELDKESVEFDFDNQFQEREFSITFSVNETAPAFEEDKIKIKAEFVYQGNGSLMKATNTTTIIFRPDFVSKIDINATDFESIAPLEETIIPINITNFGNGETNVLVEIVENEEDEFKNWNVSLEKWDIIIPVNYDDNVRQINLKVTPPENFNNKTIDLKFYTRSTPVEGIDVEDLEGLEYSFAITVENDRSLETEDEFEIDTNLLIIAIVVIVLIVGAIIFLSRRK